MDVDPLPATAPDQLLAIPLHSLAAAVPPLDAAQLTAIIVAVAFLGLSAFVSGSEISYFSLTQAMRDDLAQDSRSGRAAVRLAQAPERLLATILIANNLVNVTIVVLLNFALGPVFSGMHPVASFVVQTVILTFLILLFGEILPKLYANHDPASWARRSAPAIGAMVTVLRPLSALLMRSTGMVNRMVTKKAQPISTDDLAGALEITDVAPGDDKQMLEGILRFGDTTAAQIMTPRVDLTDIEDTDTWEQVLHTVTDSGYARIPVYHGTEDEIRGILYSRDLLPYIGTDLPDGFQWQSLLRDAYYVPESRNIDDLLEDFRSRRMHMAIVVDEYGGTQGVVTLEDVLEEIVGDINDEYDDDQPQTYRKLPNDTYIFEGRTELGDFFRITGLDPDDYQDVAQDAETLAGMLLAVRGDFPKEKEPLVYGRCRFLVLEMDGHRITSVRVRVMDTDVAQQPQDPKAPTPDGPSRSKA